MTEPSERYYAALKATQEHHARSKTFNGRFLLRYRFDVCRLVDEYGCQTMLDYGCGKGQQWDQPIDDTGKMLHEFFGCKVTKYDPGVPAYEKEPTGKFDIVVCTQVLGSIPVVDLPWAVARLQKFARKVIFVGECLGPVRKALHAHMVNEMPHNWTRARWAEALHGRGRPVYLSTRCRVSGVNVCEAV